MDKCLRYLCYFTEKNNFSPKESTTVNTVIVTAYGQTERGKAINTGGRIAQLIRCL